MQSLQVVWEWVAAHSMYSLCLKLSVLVNQNMLLLDAGLSNEQQRCAWRNLNCQHRLLCKFTWLRVGFRNVNGNSLCWVLRFRLNCEH